MIKYLLLLSVALFFSTSTFSQFIQNKGQLTDFNGQVKNDVLFYKHGKGFDVYFTKKGVSYVFSKSEFQKRKGDLTTEEKREERKAFLNDSTLFYRFDMNFSNANEDVQVKGEKELDFYSNFYLPQCENGLLNVPSLEVVSYNNIYNNISINFYFTEGKLKYDIFN